MAHIAQSLPSLSPRKMVTNHTSHRLCRLNRNVVSTVVSRAKHILTTLAHSLETRAASEPLTLQPAHCSLMLLNSAVHGCLQDQWPRVACYLLPAVNLRSARRPCVLGARRAYRLFALFMYTCFFASGPTKCPQNLVSLIAVSPYSRSPKSRITVGLQG